MTEHRKAQLERLLRRLRQRTENPRAIYLIVKTKARLGYRSPGYSTAKELWAETMWR